MGQPGWLVWDRLVRTAERVWWGGRVNLGTGSRVSVRARIVVGHRVYVGSQVRIFRDAVLDCSASPFSFSGNPYAGEPGTIRIENRTSIRPNVCLYTYGGQISIGSACTVNPYCIIYGHGGVVIGDDVHIAAQTVIVSANHGFARTDIPISAQQETRRGIRIGSNVWIGTGVRVLDGVSIGDGAIIAAGAVVTADIPSNVIAAGVPARFIREREN